jgi:DNA-binding response OmpR family regulator
MILLDINMPDINGFEVMRRIKEDRRNAEVPIIFLTSERSKKSIAEGMSLGAVDFIFKPVSETDLIKCIDYHLQPESREADLPIILAVDDNSSILQSINHLLGDQYTVATLTNPERIKNVMSSITPDLIILDCNMPIYSGFDLVPIIRGMNKHEDTPIIFLTSEGTIDHITVASGLGACDFIVKPINGDVLKNKLKLHLKDYLMHRRLRTV